MAEVVAPCCVCGRAGAGMITQGAGKRPLWWCVAHQELVTTYGRLGVQQLGKERAQVQQHVEQVERELGDALAYLAELDSLRRVMEAE